MCASLQSGARLRFALRLQDPFALKCAPRFYQHWALCGWKLLIGNLESYLESSDRWLEKYLVETV